MPLEGLQLTALLQKVKQPKILFAETFLDDRVISFFDKDQVVRRVAFLDNIDASLQKHSFVHLVLKFVCQLRWEVT